jgi:hypothetical protein
MNLGRVKPHRGVLFAPPFKPALQIREGHWWAMVDRHGDLETWAPIGRVAELRDWKDIFGCLRLAHFYCKAGILDSITGPILIVKGDDLVEVGRGNATPGVTTL